MDSKKVIAAKKKIMICMDIKLESVENQERGVCVSDLAKQYDW